MLSNEIILYSLFPNIYRGFLVNTAYIVPFTKTIVSLADLM
ncbi:hypothetical protein MNB_SM-4-404 [hydrothermal vent metagenome]|uniref:Uncharacterized protein n=1 Tax=hydrothermal vent metagenome TaxID=652676 RepID=A0A1W1BK23_9ZZZZ